jgi:adenine-specific DNA glycosylase
MTIDTRAETGDANASWTAKLLSKGVGACADKAEEEASEFIQALREESMNASPAKPPTCSITPLLACACAVSAWMM